MTYARDLDPRFNYRFEAFEVQPSERRLLRDGRPVAVTPKAFELLLLLIERRGHMVSKTELMEALWPGRIVADSNLTKHVWMLRQVLGESRDGGRCIETVSKYGYRFVAPLRSEGPGADEATTTAVVPPQIAPPDETLSAPRRLSRRIRWTLAVTVTALALAGAAAFLAPRMGSRPALRSSPADLALIDPANLSGDPSVAWIGQALTETLGAEIAGARDLRLPPAELLRPAEADLPAPGAGGYAAPTLARLRQRVDVGYVLSGAYLVYDAVGVRQLRLDLTLQDARSGRVVANLSRSGAVSELSAMVAQAGADLRHALHPGDAVGAATPATSTEVMRHMGEGLAAMRRYDPVAARDAFLQAVAQAPDYAPAYADLSQAWDQLGYKAKALSAIEQAAAHSVGLPEPQRLRIEARRQAAQFDWAGSAATLRKLIALRPGDPQDQLDLIGVLLSGSKPDQAAAALADFRRTTPEDALTDLAGAHIAAARDDTTAQAEAARKALSWAQARNLPGLAADAQLQLGGALTHRDAKAAEADIRQALAGYRQARNPRGQAAALLALGNVLAGQSPGPGREAYQQALAQFQSIGDLGGAASAQADMATMLWSQGDLDAARTALANVLALRRQTEDRVGQAWALTAGAIIDADDNAADPLLARFREAAALDLAAGANGHRGFTLFSQADVERLRGDLVQAQASCAEARAAYAKTGDAANPSADFECAMIALDRGQVDQAATAARAARAVARAQSDTMTAANADLLLGQIALGQGRNTEAAAQLETARAGYQAGDMVTGEVIALELLALNDQARGDATARQAHSAQAAALRRRVTEVQEVLAADIAAAELRAHTGASDAAAARADLKRLSADAERRRWRAWALEARLAALHITPPGPEHDKAKLQLLADARRDGFGWVRQRAEMSGAR